jgi:hypothetical protein
VAGPVAAISGRNVEDVCVASSVESWGGAGVIGWYWSRWVAAWMTAASAVAFQRRAESSFSCAIAQAWLHWPCRLLHRTR